MKPARFRGFAKRPSKKSASASMALFLCGALTLEGWTAEKLARRYGVKLAEAEVELKKALERRA
jgi:hypothetical protein